MERDEFRSRLEQLRAENLPPLTWQQVFSVPEGATPPNEDEQRLLNEYLKGFVAAPREGDKRLCVCCRNQMRGGLEGALLGGAPGSCTLEWEIGNGEARCSVCGYPYRVYHRNIGDAGDGKGPLVEFVQVGLPYHPSVLEVKE